MHKSYVADPLKHYRKLNRGELPTYLIEQNHEAIVDPATFDRVQEMRKSRYGKFYFIKEVFEAVQREIKKRQIYADFSLAMCRNQSN